MESVGFSQRPLKREASYFIKFCVVGGVGFIIDAGVLLMMTALLRQDPFTGRAVSFPVAVFVTFIFNRHWSFAHSQRSTLWRAVSAYFSVQAIGFACNILVYALAIALLPSPFNETVLCLAYASATALLVNFAGARLVVFAREKEARS